MGKSTFWNIHLFGFLVESVLGQATVHTVFIFLTKVCFLKAVWSQKISEKASRLI